MTSLSPALFSPSSRTRSFPPLVLPEHAGERLLDGVARHRALAQDALHRHGALLYRGFLLESSDDFRRFAAAFGHPLLGYEFGSTPRTAKGGGVYPST
jgi:hypothetical protein